MNPEADNLEQKRALRQAQKQKQKKKKQIRLLIIIGAVVLLIAMIFIIKGCQSYQEEQQQKQENPKTVVRIAAAGDLNVNDAVVASGGDTYDYRYAFQDILHLLSDADVTVINFEGNLVGAPYGTEERSAPQELMTALNEAGVDLVQLANSYSIYNGITGLSRTISGVRAAGMEPLGAYATEQDFEESGGYTIVDVQGVRIAFVAFTKGMDGMTLPRGSENCVNVLYEDYDSTYHSVDTDKINSILDAADGEDPDAVVVMLHWGSEFNDTISTSQNTILELLQERGVDAIIGTHSHYVQQMVYDEAKGTFLAYSLGDMFSDAQRGGTEYSAILELEITKDEITGDTKVTGFDYTPIFSVAEAGKPMRILRIREAMAAYDANFINAVSQSTYDKMKYALERIEARIKG